MKLLRELWDDYAHGACSGKNWWEPENELHFEYRETSTRADDEPIKEKKESPAQKIKISGLFSSDETSVIFKNQTKKLNDFEANEVNSKSKGNCWVGTIRMRRG